MTSIAAGQRLAAALRTQLADLRERAPARAAGAARAQAPGRSPRTVSPAMAQRIAAIAPEAPDRPRQAVRIYLEAELARAFGPGLLNDPGFATLLQAVEQGLQEDAQTAAAVDALGRLLLTGKVTPVA